MNMHPRYRRRRRVVVALLVTLAAVGFHFTGGADADIPPCHAWQNAEQCKANQ